MPDTDPSGAHAAQPLLVLADHAIHGLFHLDLDSGRIEIVEAALEKRAEQARAMRAGDLPVRLHLSDPQTPLQQPLWSDSSGKGMALDDFYPYARQILGAKPEDATVCVSLRLSSDGLQALTQVKGGKPRHWRLQLGQAAQQRCGRDSIDLRFDTARLFLFRTGVILLDLSWRYVDTGDGVPAPIVLEGNYLLSHGNLPGKAPKAAVDDCPRLDASRLLDVAQALLPTQWIEQAPLQPSRRVLYSLARVQGAAAEEALVELGVRLSHRQTSDYRPMLQSLESTVFQPFSYLCHVLAPEGAASVISSEPTASDFARNFVAGTGANTYVPLYVASLHNHVWLLMQTERLPAQSRSGKRHEVRDLEEVYERTVEFRRYFYFPMISQLSLHNAFYERCQQVFRIVERQRFLEQTTHEIAELLKARRTKWIGRVSGAVAGFLVSHELLDIVSQSGMPGSMPNLRVWFVETAHASPTAMEHLVRLVERWELIVFFGSLAGALLGYWAAWYFDRSPKPE